MSMSRERWAIALFDIDGVVRDVTHSYRRALADTVEHFTQGAYRPTQQDIDALKAEGSWNNDWEASQELVYRFFESQGKVRANVAIAYPNLVAFFQARYRGADLENPENWNGYICQEPLLMAASYLEELEQAGIGWGFFSGATRGSARYVLERRLGLVSPPLVAMEDAPSKPDPTGLLAALDQMQADPACPVLYAGDTVADIHTVNHARVLQPQRVWVAVGVLPPHVQQGKPQSQSYAAKLEQAGAQIVLNNVQDLTAPLIQSLLQS